MEFIAQVRDARWETAVIVEAESREAARSQLLEMGYLAVLWIF
jgi:hypothetical protein